MRFFSILVVSLLVFSCSREKHSAGEVIPGNQMAKVIADMLMMKEAYQQKSKVFTDNNLDVEKSVLAMHGLDSAAFYRSLKYYSFHPDEFVVVYQMADSIINRKMDSLDRMMKVEAGPGKTTNSKTDTKRQKKKRQPLKDILKLPAQ